MKNIFDQSISNEVITRINTLTPTTTPNWGKMNAPQMLAHCNVTYEFVYEPQKHKKPNFIIRFILKSFVKQVVVGEVPFKQNGSTSPDFIMTGTNKNFEIEKQRLITFITKAQQDGAVFFDGKESHGFGVLNTQEWNNLFYKHLDHHLTQFGV
jgi:hypothetical protein